MWINVIPVEEATGKLKTLYDRMRGPRNTVDNIMRVHGLRPIRWKVIWPYTRMSSITAPILFLSG